MHVNRPSLHERIHLLAASLAHMAGNSRASSTSGAGGRRLGPAAASGSAADTMDEDDYVMVDGSSIGARAAAVLAQQQPPSPTRFVVQALQAFSVAKVGQNFPMMLAGYPLGMACLSPST